MDRAGFFKASSISGSMWQCNLRQTLGISILFIASIGDAFASMSPCYQWQALVSGYQTSAQEAIDSATTLCRAAPASCGFNTTNWNFRNWRGSVGFISADGRTTTFPNYFAFLDYESQSKGPPPGPWEPAQFQFGLGFRDNPNGCQVFVTAQAATRAQVGRTCDCVNDPVNPASGAVFSIEEDAKGAVGPVFRRFYNSTDPGGGDLGPGWRHSFTRNIQAGYSSSYFKPYVTGPDYSSLYNDESLACTSGFAQIKGRVSTWANATASYANGVCTLSVGNTLIGTLPIYYTSPPTPPPMSTALIGFDATRDDGQLVSFMIIGGAIVGPASISMTLQQTASGYTLTDTGDFVESYDANGRLLSVTSRGGVVRTMGYDVSGRLSTVTDNFGHQLTLSYDSQNHLSTVTRQ